MLRLENLRDLEARVPLDSQVVVRLTGQDRAQVERAARRMGVPVGRLIRAILRHVLGEAAA